VINSAIIVQISTDLLPVLRGRPERYLWPMSHSDVSPMKNPPREKWSWHYCGAV